VARLIAVGASAYAVDAAGHGSPAVLLLHGFPQDRSCWDAVAGALAEDLTVVTCDLKGVGESRAPRGGPLGEGYSKREIAGELVELMARLGHERFAVVAHDRGARVAYRMALDHPHSVTRACVLNIVPTVEQFDAFDADSALEYWPFVLPAQPFAEELLAAGAEPVVRHILATWPATPIEPEPYLRAFTWATIAAWGAEEAIDPLPVWRRWASDVRGGPLPGGHFVPEEASAELVRSLRAFL
jgi:haloacetate dehalogenase